MSKYRVVIVDDSATMRALIASSLQNESDIEVVGMAGDPYEARDVIKRVNPDVITLDIEMPRMDGLSFLSKIMKLRPMPTIMISTFTAQGATASVQAMSLGAFDCLLKPSRDNPDTLSQLPNIIRASAGRKAVNIQSNITYRRRTKFKENAPPIFVGSSTGGVEALSIIFSEFDANCPPTFVVQHMPSSFTSSLAKRLNDLCSATVVEAEDGMKIERGKVYIAPGGERHMVIGKGSLPRIKLQPSGLVNGHRPSVDVLFNSAAQVYGANAVGVILTGMGSDGAEGLLRMRQAGAATIGQDELSSVVYGMPRAAAELGAVENQHHINNIGRQIQEDCAARSLERAG